MNNKFHTYIKQAAHDVSLSHEEREHMRHMVHGYMAMKPLRTPVQPLREERAGWFFTFRPVVLTLACALFVTSTGVSYAAQNALPGDVLYPIKTRINEPVAGVIALSSSTKTAWAMDVAGERVKEAVTLAAEGRLDASTQSGLQADFETHARQASAGIAKEAGTSPETSAETAVRFEARLSEYENVLTQIGDAKSLDTALLAESLRHERDVVAAIRYGSEAHIAAGKAAHPEAAARMGLAARTGLDRSRQLAVEARGNLSSSSVQLLAAQLDSASSAISDGNDFADKQSSSEALSAYQNALAATEKLGVFLETTSAIHARTGIRIKEPYVKQVARAAQQQDAGEHSPARSAMTLMAKDSSGSEEPENTGINASTSVQTNAEEESDEENQALPVSVPVHVSF